MEEKTVFDAIPDDVKKVMNQIQVASPVYKYNPAIENSASIAAMSLMIKTEDELHKTIEEIADKANVTDSTILFFNSRHMVEMGNFAYGTLQLFVGNGIIDQSTLIDFVNKFVMMLGKYPMFYSDYVDNVRTMLQEIITKTDNKLVNVIDIDMSERLLYILSNAIFIPYYKIDDLAKDIAKEYKDASEKKDDK